MNPPGFYRVAKALALEIRYVEFQRKAGNVYLWEVFETRLLWLEVYRWDAGEDPENYLARTGSDF